MTTPDYLVPPRRRAVHPAGRARSFHNPACSIRRSSAISSSKRSSAIRGRCARTTFPGISSTGRCAHGTTRPIRGGRRLFFVDGNRAEGWALYLEEMLLQIGYLDERPKTREITYILQAKRAARVLPELMMQANEWTYDAGAAVADQPHAVLDGAGRCDRALRHRAVPAPARLWHRLLHGQSRAGSSCFPSARCSSATSSTCKRFHDEFLQAGVIPISLIRWEMTGRDDEIRRMR